MALRSCTYGPLFCPRIKIICIRIETTETQSRGSCEYSLGSQGEGSLGRTLMTAELSPIQIGRLIPVGLPVGRESGQEIGESQPGGKIRTGSLPQDHIVITRPRPRQACMLNVKAHPALEA